MSFMPWTTELETGIQSIDEQHQWLVKTTNELFDEVNSDTPDRNHIGQIIESLVDYTYNHFIVEEDIFKRLNYPESAEHVAEHNKFTATASELLSRFDSGQTVSGEALEFLKDWLLHHILKVDKSYVPFMLEHGIT